MWGKILGALFGMAILKIPGLFIGIFIGHLFDRAWQQRHRSWSGWSSSVNADEQAMFMFTTFATMGHLAKAKGVVTPSDIRQATELMQQLGLDTAQQKEAQLAFGQGKSSGYQFKPPLQRFFQHYQQRPDVLRLFMEFQFSSACADGQLSAEQWQLLQQVGLQLQFTARECEQMRNSCQAQSRFCHGQPGSAKALQDAYKVLAAEPSMTDIELKRCYRKLMAQHHPDKLMAQGVPTAMLEVAKRRTQELQAAYELIKQQRAVKTSR
ncbi:co-chaperone DjlA [Arsukibacterium sp.]|uniref:co-chaperone DjlA n=1 Tax=Arsukibacterium sp. TaxID=1977258 RepID=UPI002FD8BB88